jgi:Tfp pilus assembly protein PilE
MLGSNRGFTIVQFIVGMTVGCLLLMWIGVMVVQRSWRDGQRRTDLAQVEAMVNRVAQLRHGRYPPTGDAALVGSELRTQFEALRLEDPKSNSYYVLGASFDACKRSGSSDERGPGYISYKSPGDDGPFLLRMCLESGEYEVGN